MDTMDNTDITVVTADENSGTYVHEFAKPFKWEDKTYKTLNFYFGDLTGSDIMSVEEEMSNNGEIAIVPEVSTRYQCHLAARAAKIDWEALAHLPAREYSKICNKARSFLLGTD